MELRCPECCSPEVDPDPRGAADARRCGNCGARFSREAAFVTVAEAEALSSPAPSSADGDLLDRLAEFLNGPEARSGADVAERLARELHESGRPILDRE